MVSPQQRLERNDGNPQDVEDIPDQLNKENLEEVSSSQMQGPVLNSRLQPEESHQPGENGKCM